MLTLQSFSPTQMKALIRASTIKPAVHQFELHPYLQQADWVEWHHQNMISVTAYSPLGNLNPIYDSPGRSKSKPPSLLENKDVSDIAKERGCTNAQVALSWGMGRGYSVIPKSQVSASSLLIIPSVVFSGALRHWPQDLSPL